MPKRCVLIGKKRVHNANAHLRTFSFSGAIRQALYECSLYRKCIGCVLLAAALAGGIELKGFATAVSAYEITCGV